MRTLIILASVTLVANFSLAQTNFQQLLAEEIESLTALIENDPYNAEAYEKRAGYIFKLNSTDPDQKLVSFDLRDALKDIDLAISLDCNNAHLFSIRAELKRDINLDYRGAVTDMDIAIRLNRGNPDYYLQRANYQELSKGCVDYRKCASYDDKRCQQIVKEACM